VVATIRAPQLGQERQERLSFSHLWVPAHAAHHVANHDWLARLPVLEEDGKVPARERDEREMEGE
jgi:hypothetical protein